ncbi:uncharacterized protein LOC124699120 isoform X2 [Lolium rigidum]|uniref:uncharacterized protein LOC124699120 isoform X2 n=1 Tax=Lolium rigidum TaxID=89674 RepID=UPI001F5DFD01|nr:uncharacterized protein LOC124699120 isoform X2 [Lolium rigidum]
MAQVISVVMERRFPQVVINANKGQLFQASHSQQLTLREPMLPAKQQQATRNLEKGLSAMKFAKEYQKHMTGMEEDLHALGLERLKEMIKKYLLPTGPRRRERRRRPRRCWHKEQSRTWLNIFPLFWTIKSGMNST